MRNDGKRHCHRCTGRNGRQLSRNRLWAMRIERNMSQEQLAAEAGVSRKLLYRLECGDVQVHLGALKRLSDYFDMPMAKLMEKVEE